MGKLKVLDKDKDNFMTGPVVLMGAVRGNRDAGVLESSV